MKLIVAWLAVLSFTVISAGSCTIRHKSGDYECTTQTDCETGRQCLGGYCVVPGGGPIDAPKTNDGPRTDGPQPDSSMCPAQCTSCANGKVCNIDCGSTNCTGNNAIVCPSGWNCAILCSTNNSCANGINCGGAASCAVTCSGQGSCRNIECGAGACDVKCEGSNSCRGVVCSNSCACDVSCGTAAACEFLTCSSIQCDPFGKGCTSIGPTCDTCP